jgi:membrane-associated phospholipid phosphatase
MSHKEPKRFFAELISGVLHPIVVPIFAFWGLLEFGYKNDPNRYVYLAILILICSLVPSLIVVMLKSMGKISDYDISNREQRSVPLLIAVVPYFIGYLLLEYFHAPRMISGLMLFYTANTLVIIFITLRWKISVHLSSYSAPIAVLYLQFGPVVLWLLLLVPLLMWSRVHLKAHTPMQTLAGSALGFTLLLAELTWWMNRG